MRRLLPLLLLAAGTHCAGRLYSATTASSLRAPDDVYACIQEQLGKLGYRRTHFDPGDRWYVAQKSDPDARLSDVRFRQRINRLDFRVRPDATGNSSIEIKAQSFNQFADQQGFSDTQVAASERAKADAAQVATSCAQ
jgi:hypothetical protein